MGVDSSTSVDYPSPQYGNQRDDDNGVMAREQYVHITCTHAKFPKQAFNKLCSRDSFPVVGTSWEQVWNKLLTDFNELVDIINVVTRLF